MVKGYATLVMLNAAFGAFTIYAAEGFKDTRVSNDVLSVGVSVRDAGAVCSILYDGMELVNDHDHGRQLQVAWTYNDLDEKYNPTEAGSDKDFTKVTSTSKLVAIRADKAALTTESHPAYWLPPKIGVNTTLVTNDLLTKTITVGWQGDVHVIVVDSTIAIAAELTGPPIASSRIEAPTIYAAGILTDHYTFDMRTLKATKSTVKPNRKDAMNETIRQLMDRATVPVMSSPDGKYAIGMYTAQAEGFWSYYAWGVPSDDPKNACNKATVFFKHPVQTAKTYSYRSFLAIGDLETVKKSLKRLAAAK